MTRSKKVPVAVGAALGALVLGLVVAYGVALRRPAPLSTAERAAQLRTAFGGALHGADREAQCRLFFDLFPNSFAELQALYGFDPGGAGPAPLYEQAYQHFNELFNQLDCVEERAYYGKLVAIAVDAHWEADAVTYFQTGLWEHSKARPELLIELLRARDDAQVSRLFDFLFTWGDSAPAEIPPQLLGAASRDQRLRMLMLQSHEGARSREPHRALQ